MNRRFILLALPLAVLTACSSDDGETGDNSGTPMQESKPFVFNVSQEPLTDPDHPDADRVKVSLDQMEKLFLSTLREIKKDFPRLDHAMFPVDPRLEQEMLRGMFQLLKTIEVGQLHPMHFCLPPDIA